MFYPFLPSDSRAGLCEILSDVSVSVRLNTRGWRCMNVAKEIPHKVLYPQVDVHCRLVESNSPAEYSAWAGLFEDRASAVFYAYSFLVLEREMLLDFYAEENARSPLCFSNVERSVAMSVVSGVLDWLEGTDLGDKLLPKSGVLAPRFVARMYLDWMSVNDAVTYEKVVALFLTAECAVDYVSEWFRLEREIMRKESLQLRAQIADYSARVNSGKVTPFAHKEE